MKKLKNPRTSSSLSLMAKFVACGFMVTTFIACGGAPQTSSSAVLSSSVSSSSVGLSSSSISIASSINSVSSSSSSSSSVAPTPVATITLQESFKGFCRVDGVIETEHTGFTGTGYANGDNAANTKITWQIKSPASQMATLQFRYANGGDSSRAASVAVNDAGVKPIEFAVTGWTAWQLATVTVNLSAGSNRITLTSNSAAGLANIDSLQVQAPDVDADDCPPPPAATDVEINRGVYSIVASQSNKLLEVSEASNSDGANVVQWSDLKGSNQRWIVREVIDNYYSIVNVQSGKALEVLDMGTANGANVVQYDYWQGDSQLWRILDAGNGSVQIINRLSEKALTVAGGGNSDGANVEQNTATGGAGQLWKLNFLGKVDGPVEDKSVTNGATNHWVMSGDTFAHDPTLYIENGKYYLYYTASWIAAKQSNDGRNWSRPSSVLPGRFSWWDSAIPGWPGSENTTNNVWAPEVDRYGDRLWMWYSLSFFGQRNSAIGLMSATSAAAADWRDEGLAIKSNNSVDYNAIDADLAVDEYGDPWMTFGSWSSGIKLTRLNPLTMKPVGRLYSIASKGGGIEAPDVFYRKGYYYLFVSLGVCCDGANSTYRIAYGRSEKITGPYLDKSGKDMMAGGGSILDSGSSTWFGPGGQDIINTNLIVRHSYPASGNPWAAVLISTLNWDSDGWPKY